ncbi:chemotaxis protein CheW [Pseudanabaena minima]|uniref:chemotaxis protein CheW n=1 Tax=Pseudanabaena minima TaxID=890415 RepID=UPI003DA8F5AB
MSISEMSRDHRDDTDNLLDHQDHLVAPSNRYIVAKVGDRSVTFPDVLISEIIILERNAILALPFYETAIIGVTHHQATVMPLLLLRLLMGEQRTLITESLTVVRLSKIADDLGNQNLGGVGIIVDRVVGSLTINEFQELDISASDNNSPKKIPQTVANIKENEYTPIEIILSSIPTHIWQPQRWQISS